MHACHGNSRQLVHFCIATRRNAISSAVRQIRTLRSPFAREAGDIASEQVLVCGCMLMAMHGRVLTVAVRMHAGQKSNSASEWSLCYGGILGDTVTQVRRRKM